MSQLPSNPERTSDASAAPAATPGQPQAPRVEVDDSQVVASYANFCRVTGTPEELILDFGLSPQAFEVPTEPVVVSQRIIANLYTAKRMLYAIHMAIQHYETTFGPLEMNVQNRVRTAGKP